VKSGTENRTKTIIAVVLMAVALIVFARKMLFNSGGGYAAPTSGGATASAPVSNQSAPARTTRTTTARNNTRGQNAPAVVAQSLDPRLRLDLLKQTEETKYTGSGRNIFSDEPPPPPAPKIPEVEKSPIVQQQGPPPPPPINLKFFGFASRTGTTKKIFLSQGEDVFVASEGDIVQRRYRILRINPTSIDVEDVLTNNRQTIPLTAG
jgi:hypothetical protein